MQTVSVIIEWENVLIAEMDRCRLMLRELRRQILELQELRAQKSPDDLASLMFPLEILIVHDRDHVPVNVIEREVGQAFAANDPCAKVRIAGTSGEHYYGLKNFGARQVASDIVLFLDSDVIPQTGWLRHLLKTFENPEVQVVGGNTFVDPANLLGKTFALTWIFPRFSPETSLVKAANFFANNVAFRRDTFLRYGFPEVPGTCRGSCGKLARTMREQGVEIYLHQAARVSHPPTNGLKHFVIRGVAQGRDDVFVRRDQRGRSWCLREAWRQVQTCWRITTCGLASIFKYRKTVALPLWLTPVAAVITFCYYQCRLTGALLAQLFPKYMQNHFRI